MLRQRNKNSELPLTNAGYLNSATFVDGSGKSIKTEAPILKAARNASAYTRYSYIWLFGSVFSIFFGWYFVSYRYGESKVLRV